MADDELVVRACRVDDAAGLAAMYALDRGEIEGAEPWRGPSFFEVDGTRRDPRPASAPAGAARGSVGHLRSSGRRRVGT